MFDKIVLFTKYNILLNERVLNSSFARLFSYNSLFYNWEFLDILSYYNTTKLYVFYSILLKKQNSFLRKKNNLLSNYYSVSQKSRELGDYSGKCYNVSWQVNKYNLFWSTVSHLDITKVLDLRKKISKTILENRKIFSSFFYSKSKRSFKINRLVLLLGQKKIWNMCVCLELGIVQVLLNSGLIKSVNDALNFLSSGYVYVNRQPVFSSNYILRRGDILELVFNKTYYIYLLRLRTLNDKINSKMRNKLWLKLKNKTSLTIGNERFLINCYKNNYIYKFYIPSYLEVDYSVLTTIVISGINSYFDLSFFFRKFLVYFFIRHYNWKWLS